MVMPNENELKERLLKSVANQRRLRRAVASAPGDIELEDASNLDLAPGDILAELDIDVSPSVEGIR